MRASGKTENVGHPILIRFGALSLDVVEDSGFEPTSGRVVGRLDVPALLQHESVFSVGPGSAGQSSADFRGIQIDHAVERARLEMGERLWPQIEDFGDVRVPLQ